MQRDGPKSSLNDADRQMQADRLASVKRYGRPRRVWVDDGHVFLEGPDGEMVSMTPEVAIEMGRLLSQAGSDSLINRVMDDDAASQTSQLE